MNKMGLGESCVRRIILVGGATAIVMLALLFSKPFYSAMNNQRQPAVLT